MFKDLLLFAVRYVLLAVAVKLSDRGIIPAGQNEAFVQEALPYVIGAAVLLWGARAVIKARILALTMGAMHQPTIASAKAEIRRKRAPPVMIRDHQVPRLRP